MEQRDERDDTFVFDELITVYANTSSFFPTTIRPRPLSPLLWVLYLTFDLAFIQLTYIQ